MSNKTRDTFSKIADGKIAVIDELLDKISSFDNYYYHTQGSTLLKSGQPKGIQLTLPSGKL